MKAFALYSTQRWTQPQLRTELLSDIMHNHNVKANFIHLESICVVAAIAAVVVAFVGVAVVSLSPAVFRQLSWRIIVHQSWFFIDFLFINLPCLLFIMFVFFCDFLSIFCTYCFSSFYNDMHLWQRKYILFVYKRFTFFVCVKLWFMRVCACVLFLCSFYAALFVCSYCESAVRFCLRYVFKFMLTISLGDSGVSRRCPVQNDLNKYF